MMTFPSRATSPVSADTLLHIPQRSEAWFEARLGAVTSSRIADAMSKLKRGGDSAARKNLMADLVSERLTGCAVERFVTPEMKWGIEHEEEACRAYERHTGASLQLIGYVTHPRIESAGASPDRLLGDDALVELKCPSSKTHIAYMMDGLLPNEYEPQVMWQLACTGRRMAHFVSYDPRMPEHLRLLIVPVHRDDARIAELESGVTQFLREVDATIDILNRRNPGKEPPPKAKLHIDPDMMITDADLPSWWKTQNP